MEQRQRPRKSRDLDRRRRKLGMRKVFFSFHHKRDVLRVAVVRNSNRFMGNQQNPWLDNAEWEKLKRTGNAAVQSWIDDQLRGSSVTVVLIGAETANRPWVKYEIAKSIEMGKGLIGIYINRVPSMLSPSDPRGANPLPAGYPTYDWQDNVGRMNLGRWIEAEARRHGL